MRMRWSLCALVLGGVVAEPSAAAVISYNAGTLDFQSANQSMWGPGTAFSKSESVFLGTQWTNKTATIGGIAGDANQVIIPAIDAAYITLYEPKIWVPTPTWSDPFKGHYAGCGCNKQVQITPNIPAVTVDTRTGAQLNVHSSGKVGLEFGYSITSGFVDTQANFNAAASLPDQVAASQYFNLNPTSDFSNGNIDTQSPTLDAHMSTILQLSGSVDAKACATTFGCATSGSVNLPNVNLDQRILSVDPNSLKVLDGIGPGGQPFAEVPIANQTFTLEGGATVAPPVVGFKLTGPLGVTIASSLPPTPSVSADLAEVTLFAPNIATSGVGSNAPVTSSGRDDILSAQLDIDGAATFMAGLPPVGLNFDLIDTPVFKLGASLDLIDVKAGPVLGLTQNFEFNPTLMTTIDFSKPVQIAGMAGLQNSWTGKWSDLPDFALTETTTFSPTFWLDATLTNKMGLDLGLSGTLDLLKLGATATVGGLDLVNFDPISLNNLLGIDDTLFSTPKLQFSLFSNTFDLGGFNRVMGTPFTLMVAAAGAVPEPAILWLLTLGLAGLFAVANARNRAANGHPV